MGRAAAARRGDGRKTTTTTTIATALTTRRHDDNDNDYHDRARAQQLTRPQPLDTWLGDIGTLLLTAVSFESCPWSATEARARVVTARV